MDGQTLQDAHACMHAWIHIQCEIFGKTAETNYLRDPLSGSTETKTHWVLAKFIIIILIINLIVRRKNASCKSTPVLYLASWHLWASHVALASHKAATHELPVADTRSERHNPNADIFAQSIAALTGVWEEEVYEQRENDKEKDKWQTAKTTNYVYMSA